MDEQLLIEVIDGLLRYKQNTIKSTEVFKSMKHNKNLCPAVDKISKSILDCFNKYQKVVYDIQGIGDRGSDILIRFGQKNFDKYIVMQIKSYDDLEKDIYLSKLRLQFDDASDEYGEKLVHYYILLCTDEEKHKNKIRQINNKFSKKTNVTVIEPTYMISFLTHSQLRINAFVEYLTKKEDIVYKNALRVINELTPTEIAIVLSLSFDVIEYGTRIFNKERILNDSFILETSSKTPDYERNYYFRDYEYFDEDYISELKKVLNRKIEDRISNDLDYLQDNYLWINNTTGEYEIDIKYFKPLLSILLDSQIRFKYEKNELLKYMFNLFRIFERYNLEIEL